MLRITIERLWLLLFSAIYGIGYFLAPYAYKLYEQVIKECTYEPTERPDISAIGEQECCYSNYTGFHWYEQGYWYRRSAYGYWQPVGYNWRASRGKDWQAYWTGKRG